MTTYIIRIYRHETQYPGNVVGRIENIETGDTNTFHSIAGLVNELTSSLGCKTEEEQVQFVVEGNAARP
ncbi:MAG: hypothetical protein KAS48_08640 [Gammaproteobacteria bacterium]|nr:hypothetical protein [Gammaproteobacteria bacterium]MCK5091028.1 hypothetical protein [Gammaproteobacteria bacterium]